MHGQALGTGQPAHTPPSCARACPLPLVFRRCAPSLSAGGPFPWDSGPDPLRSLGSVQEAGLQLGWARKGRLLFTLLELSALG